MTIQSRYKYIYTSSSFKINQYYIEWHITDWCNYNCPYCIQTVNHHYGIRPKESQEEVEQTASFIRDKIKGQNVTLSFHGGEISVFYDLKKIAEILFNDNGCKGTLSLTTNLSAPIEKYLNFLNANTDGVRTKITSSYQWRDIDSFIEKSKIIKEMCPSYQITCVVWDKITKEQIEETIKKFSDNELQIRFTHGRIADSGHKLYKLNDNVLNIIQLNNSQYKRISCKIVYSDNKEDTSKSRSEVLREIADFQGLDGASMKGMICFTGCIITKEGDVYDGSCYDRRNGYRGKISDANVSLKPCKKVCTTDKFCNLCDSILVWNGRY